jgi:hypothetical protein
MPVPDDRTPSDDPSDRTFEDDESAEGRAREDDESAEGRAREDDEPAVERAREISDEVAAENPDPITRREAIEGELEEEGLSEAGGNLGEHNE